MDAPVKKTRAERAAEKVAREAARREAIERLKKTAFTAPPWLSTAGVLRTRAWIKQAQRCQRLSETQRVKPERLTAAADALQAIETKSLEDLNKTINPKHYV